MAWSVKRKKKRRERRETRAVGREAEVKMEKAPFVRGAGGSADGGAPLVEVPLVGVGGTARRGDLLEVRQLLLEPPHDGVAP